MRTRWRSRRRARSDDRRRVSLDGPTRPVDLAGARRRSVPASGPSAASARSDRVPEARSCPSRSEVMRLTVRGHRSSFGEGFPAIRLLPRTRFQDRVGPATAPAARRPYGMLTRGSYIAQGTRTARCLTTIQSVVQGRARMRGLVLIVAGVLTLAVAATLGPVALAGDKQRTADERKRISGRDLRGVNFIESCRFSHRAPDDPIVFPGKPGASHDHTFVGNRTTNALRRTARFAPGATTCSARTTRPRTGCRRSTRARLPCSPRRPRSTTGARPSPRSARSRATCA